MPKLEVGQTAPDFTVSTTEGELSLQELLSRGSLGVVVYFYPRAMTPGCTTEACDFRDSLQSLKGAGYTVLGVSADPMEKLEKFRDKYDLNFPLASDPDRQLLEAYGAWGEKMNYGKRLLGAIRSTVVVAKDGTVQVAQYNVRAKGHVERLRRDLGI